MRKRLIALTTTAIIFLLVACTVPLNPTVPTTTPSPTSPASVINVNSTITLEQTTVNNTTYVRASNFKGPVVRIGDNVTLDNVTIKGLGPCDNVWPPPPFTWGAPVANYTTTTDSHHNLTINGDNVQLSNVILSDGSGDGILVDGADNLQVNGLTVRCARRGGFVVVDGRNIVANNLNVSGIGLWAFNFEPWGTRNVSNVTFNNTVVGMSAGGWLNAQGPDFNCAVTGVRFNSPDLRGAARGTYVVKSCASISVLNPLLAPGAWTP